MMKFKGYQAKVEIDGDAKLFHGRVINLHDVITFEVACRDDLLQAIHNSVDEYLEFCTERGEDSEKPYDFDST